MMSYKTLKRLLLWERKQPSGKVVGCQLPGATKMAEVLDHPCEPEAPKIETMVREASSENVQLPIEEELAPSLLLPCVTCGRTFRPEALAKHNKVCEMSLMKKRKQFDSAKQRIQGTDLAQFASPPLPGSTVKQLSAKKRAVGGGSEHPGSPVSVRQAAKWREKQEALAGGGGHSVKMGLGSSPINEKCPHCDRHFGPKAFDRHVEWCKEQQTRVQSKSQACLEAKERLQARTKYRAPLNKTQRTLTKEKYSPVRPTREPSPSVGRATNQFRLQETVREVNNMASTPALSRSSPQRSSFKQASPAGRIPVIAPRNLSRSNSLRNTPMKFNPEAVPPSVPPPQQTTKQLPSLVSKPKLMTKPAATTEKRGTQKVVVGIIIEALILKIGHRTLGSRLPVASRNPRCVNRPVKVNSTRVIDDIEGLMVSPCVLHNSLERPSGPENNSSRCSNANRERKTGRGNVRSSVSPTGGIVPERTGEDGNPEEISRHVREPYNGERSVGTAGSWRERASNPHSSSDDGTTWVFVDSNSISSLDDGLKVGEHGVSRLDETYIVENRDHAGGLMSEYSLDGLTIDDLLTRNRASYVGDDTGEVGQVLNRTYVVEREKRYVFSEVSNGYRNVEGIPTGIDVDGSNRRGTPEDTGTDGAAHTSNENRCNINYTIVESLTVDVHSDNVKGCDSVSEKFERSTVTNVNCTEEPTSVKMSMKDYILGRLPDYVDAVVDDLLENDDSCTVRREEDGASEDVRGVYSVDSLCIGNDTVQVSNVRYTAEQTSRVSGQNGETYTIDRRVDSETDNLFMGVENNVGVTVHNLNARDDAERFVNGRKKNDDLCRLDIAHNLEGSWVGPPGAVGGATSDHPSKFIVGNRFFRGRKQNYSEDSLNVRAEEVCCIGAERTAGANSGSGMVTWSSLVIGSGDERQKIVGGPEVPVVDTRPRRKCLSERCGEGSCSGESAADELSDDSSMGDDVGSVNEDIAEDVSKIQAREVPPEDSELNSCSEPVNLEAGREQFEEGLLDFNSNLAPDVLYADCDLEPRIDNYCAQYQSQSNCRSVEGDIPTEQTEEGNEHSGTGIGSTSVEELSEKNGGSTIPDFHNVGISSDFRPQDSNSSQVNNSRPLDEETGRDSYNFKVNTHNSDGEFEVRSLFYSRNSGPAAETTEGSDLPAALNSFGFCSDPKIEGTSSRTTPDDTGVAENDTSLNYFGFMENCAVISECFPGDAFIPEYVNEGQNCLNDPGRSIGGRELEERYNNVDQYPDFKYCSGQESSPSVVRSRSTRSDERTIGVQSSALGGSRRDGYSDRVTNFLMDDCINETPTRDVPEGGKKLSNPNEEAASKNVIGIDNMTNSSVEVINRDSGGVKDFDVSRMGENHPVDSSKHRIGLKRTSLVGCTSGSGNKREHSVDSLPLLPRRRKIHQVSRSVPAICNREASDSCLGSNWSGSLDSDDWKSTASSWDLRNVDSGEYLSTTSGECVCYETLEYVEEGGSYCAVKTSVSSFPGMFGGNSGQRRRGTGRQEGPRCWTEVGEGERRNFRLPPLQRRRACSSGISRRTSFPHVVRHIITAVLPKRLSLDDIEKYDPYVSAKLQMLELFSNDSDAQDNGNSPSPDTASSASSSDTPTSIKTAPAIPASRVSPPSAFAKFLPISPEKPTHFSNSNENENNNNNNNRENNNNNIEKVDNRRNMSLSNLSLCSVISLDSLDYNKSPPVPEPSRSGKNSRSGSGRESRHAAKSKPNMQQMLYGTLPQGRDPSPPRDQLEAELLVSMLEIEKMLSSSPVLPPTDTSPPVLCSSGSSPPTAAADLQGGGEDDDAEKMAYMGTEDDPNPTTKHTNIQPSDSAYSSLTRKTPVDGLDPAPTALRTEFACSKFCHECGAKYPVAAAKFCCQCGIRRLNI